MRSDHSGWKDLRRSLAQPPAQAGSAVMSDQVAQSFVTTCLEILQEWRPHSLTRQPVQRVDCSHRENNFAYIQSVLFLFQLTPIASHPPAIPHCEELGSIFSITSPRNWKAAVRSPPTHLFSRLNKSTSPSLSARGKCSSP